MVFQSIDYERIWRRRTKLCINGCIIFTTSASAGGLFVSKGFDTNMAYLIYVCLKNKFPNNEFIKTKINHIQTWGSLSNYNHLNFYQYKQKIKQSKMNKIYTYIVYKSKNKITELRTILQRESQNSYLYKQTKSVNNRKTVKTVMTLIILL